MTILETLKAARAKIADEKNWTQNANARDSYGELTASSDQGAVCWCAQGAILSILSISYPATNGAWSAIAALTESPDDDTNPVVVFNDSHTHAEVLALFDKAIAEAR